VVLLVVSLSSGSVRAHLTVYISRSFFEYKYDYRDEWLRFIQTISRSELDEMLERRVIRAVADLVDSPEGAIWSRDGNRLSLATVWNVSRWNLPRADVAVPVDSALIEYLAKTQHVLDVTEFRENPAAYPGLELPAWMVETSQAWLILPLIHLERLLGILVLGKPRAPRTLNWEDYDLLRTVGRQAASYLAEQAAGRALHEARQFEEFNHRFAFVVHDIKNLASQLSLVLANAERHKANAEFQEDMLLTIRGSVDKMTRLLTQLHGRPASIEDSKSVELAAMLKLIAEEFRSAAVKVTLDLQRTELVVSADPDRLFAVVHQLVQNAVEAASSRVDLRLAGLDDEALVEVVDDGPGMSAEFVRNALFRPFRSTKTTGYGIGAYEARDYIRSIGGDLEVVSAPRKGTTMRVKLSLPSAMAARISEKHLAKGVG
jgi:putative PEP-CTERM system histidine kinase